MREWRMSGSGSGTATATGCYKCGKPGHWSRDCPFSPPPSNPNNPPSSSSFNPNSGGSGSGSGGPKSASEKPKKLPRSRPKLTPDLLLSDDGLGYVLRYFPSQFTYRGRGHEVLLTNPIYLSIFFQFIHSFILLLSIYLSIPLYRFRIWETCFGYTRNGTLASSLITHSINSFTNSRKLLPLGVSRSIIISPLSSHFQFTIRFGQNFGRASLYVNHTSFSNFSLDFREICVSVFIDR